MLVGTLSIFLVYPIIFGGKTSILGFPIIGYRRVQVCELGSVSYYDQGVCGLAPMAFCSFVKRFLSLLGEIC